VLVNVGFSGPAATTAIPSAALRIANCQTVMFGVMVYCGSLQLVGGRAFAGCLAASGQSSTSTPATGVLVPYASGADSSYVAAALPDIGVADTFKWLGWGIASPWQSVTQRSPLLFDNGAEFVGGFVGDWARVPVGCKAVFVGCSFVSNGATLGSGRLNVDGDAFIQNTILLPLVAGGALLGPGVPPYSEMAGTFLNATITARTRIDELEFVNTSASAIILSLTGGTFTAWLSYGGGGTGIRGTATGGFFMSAVNCFAVYFVTSVAAPVNCTFANAGSTAMACGNTKVYGLQHFNFGTNGAISATGGSVYSGPLSAGVCSTVTSNESSIEFSGAGTLSLSAATSAANAVIALNQGRVLMNSITLTQSGAFSATVDSCITIAGSVGTSAVTSTHASGALQNSTGSKINLAGITAGTLTATQSAANRACAQIRGELWLPAAARISLTGTTYAVDHSNGGRVYTSGQPTSCVGTTKDFIDEAATTAAFNDTELSAADVCIFRGQHAAGTYSSTTAPTGSGFVQRVA
jgi:hypothetical protein